MDYGISRARALDLLKQYVNQPNLRNHSLASEAVMGKLARHLGADETLWRLTGLLHDLDAELTKDDMHRHTHETARILREEGVTEEIIEAICLHNEHAHEQRRSQPLHHALAAAETITGLITATALVYPDKKLAGVKPKSVRKRFKEKLFAAGANRDIISECEKIGVSIPDFCDLSLEAMQDIAPELGL
ncbi:HDIG domain-containing metalloprotein [Pelovirga terrestris]|uniref:HDIG domain-containing protein n=1 Tax=Pelovirga terrestris TaxID=2771352 RepID=A0A8J6UQ48_9BACT|nr:HDIG domain-containing metalloprotein [Pelovirga terrestris]MBD1401504.1 HDIG domain-containing protein [Pelovirga terrestris]